MQIYCNKSLILSTNTNTNLPEWYALLIFYRVMCKINEKLLYPASKENILTKQKKKSFKFRNCMSCFYLLHSCNSLTWQTDLLVGCSTPTHSTRTPWNAGLVCLLLQSVSCWKWYQSIEIFLSSYFLSVFYFKISAVVVAI